ncbi:ABC transporter substrate-binding protein [Sphingomonas quercus]|uniref:ABC transporter substrate-binding protein n=1 Tax=Sphingomonas quercus TaxID=2842451 RepID=A0ABS6BK89_9SPHN|nr:ABC transporter substrate-binding protein [Sphingomonas quercus]MBU3078695.1 ABC transporter substrate-binding protein [Sphingomonas quercus]
MRPRLLILILALAATSGAAAPRRIVSLNLCADQYLLALADPGQIAALTQYARDPAMSAEPGRAARLPFSRGSAEEVMALDPDLILSTPYRRMDALAAAGRHYPTITLDPADSYAAIRDQVRQVAGAIGHPERGEALVRRMDAALARLPRNAGGGRVAAYYQRRGYLTGRGTLIDDLMARAGLVNLAARLGRPALSRLSLEQLVAARPDFLIVETDSAHVADQGTEMLQHPALRHIPRLSLPQAWTVCGGPAYVLAAASLIGQLEPRIPRPPAPSRHRGTGASPGPSR